MSTKRPPIFTEQQLFGDESPLLERVPGDRHVANYFTALAEAARAKDAELIQQLVDALDMVLKSSALERGNKSVYMGDRNSGCVHFGNQAISSAAAAGFKPSKP